MPLIGNLSEGQRFGKLRVVARVYDATFSGAKFVCICDCGNMVEKRPFLLRSKWPSCGCLPVRGGKMTLEPFERRFEKGDGCWEWKGAKTKAGYGWFSAKIASRISWEIYRGKIPKDMLVCHKCDNPPCVNPDHLFLGTHKDNTLDMIKKGRGRMQKEKRKRDGL